MMYNVFDLLNFKETLQPVHETTIAQYRNVLPDFVLEEWEQRGLASYSNGLLMTTNPNDFYDIIDGWVDEPKKCHVVMRSAFGTFYYLKDGEYYGMSIVYKIRSHYQNDFSVIIEFIISTKSHQKDSLMKDIYEKIFKRIGPPTYDEVYAFVPAIVLGGDYNPDSVQKVKLKEHLAFLVQL